MNLKKVNVQKLRIRGTDAMSQLFQKWSDNEEETVDKLSTKPSSQTFSDCEQNVLYEVFRNRFI
jgi:hypothetical protein